MRQEASNKLSYTKDVKATILLCLSLINAKRSEFKYDFLNEENKVKYKELFEKLEVGY